MFAWQFCKALHLADRHGWTRFVSMQNHYNLIHREEEREMMGLCLAEGNWGDSVESAGARAIDAALEQKGNTKRGESDEFGKKLYGGTEESDRLVVERVSQLPRKRGVPQAQIALAWMLQKPYITSPIIGATKVQHLDDAVAALAVKLSPEEIASLEEPYVPHPIVGFS
jgi:aryl-alcohol dehydrogenase-like predicted oxidoreductase